MEGHDSKTRHSAFSLAQVTGPERLLTWGECILHSHVGNLATRLRNTLRWCVCSFSSSWWQGILVSLLIIIFLNSQWQGVWKLRIKRKNTWEQTDFASVLFIVSSAIAHCPMVFFCSSKVILNSKVVTTNIIWFSCGALWVSGHITISFCVRPQIFRHLLIRT